jgi:hypothetical protein
MNWLGLNIVAYMGIFGALFPDSAQGFEGAMGITAVEEGDDVQHLGASAHFGLNPFHQMRITTWGREFGPVIESKQVLSVSRRFGIMHSKYLSADAGLCLLREYTKIAAIGESKKVEESYYNFGGVFGVSYTILNAPLYMSFSWQSHVFPAGFGGLLLATGRKQTISFNIGFGM